ncbi:MAG: HAMP domain-containing histidine kinase [Verrucomicrobia bacterium]|nr:HAMP domain-containing histidine kinase [Verrucomicrobiota bacterium]
MISKTSQFAAFAAHFLLIAAAGAAVLAIGTFLFPQQLPPVTCLVALGAVVGASLVASALLARHQLASRTPISAGLAGNRESAKAAGFGFFSDEAFGSDLQMLCDEFERWLKTATDFGRCQIFLQSVGSEEMTRAEPVRANLSEPGFALTPDSPLWRFFQETAEACLTANSPRNTAGELAAAARAACHSLGAAVCLPLRGETDLFGLLILGERRSDGRTLDASLELVILAARQLSLLISHQRLRDQLRSARDTELLGTISRGLAHDLNNLITPAWTYLQLCQSGEAGPGANTELLPTALRSMETMRDYVEEALFFSENHQPQFRLGHLEATVQKVIEAAAPAIKRAGLQLHTTVEANLTAYYDEILMRRLIGNLLNNAIDASPAGSRIDIEVLPLTKTNPRQDWLRLRVRDQGSGMTSENVKRALDRYYSAQDSRAEGRGNGLGLAICQKIVKLHHGELQLASFAGRGTTVEIDLPRQEPNRGAVAGVPPAATRLGIIHIA